MTEEETAALVEYRLEQDQVALGDAKFLLDGGRSPQGIINRAYYAMFYAALALLQKTGKTVSKHAGVLSLFDTQFVLQGTFPRQMSKDFHRAFELRQTSDYRTVRPVSRDKAEEAWQKAATFVEAIKAFLQPSKAS